MRKTLVAVRRFCLHDVVGAVRQEAGVEAAQVIRQQLCPVVLPHAHGLAVLESDQATLRRIGIADVIVAIVVGSLREDVELAALKVDPIAVGISHFNAVEIKG